MRILVTEPLDQAGVTMLQEKWTVDLGLGLPAQRQALQQRALLWREIAACRLRIDVADVAQESPRRLCGLSGVDLAIRVAGSTVMATVAFAVPPCPSEIA